MSSFIHFKRPSCWEGCVLLPTEMDALRGHLVARLLFGGINVLHAAPIPPCSLLRSLTPFGGKLGARFLCCSIDNFHAAPIISCLPRKVNARLSPSSTHPFLIAVTTQKISFQTDIVSTRFQVMIHRSGNSWNPESPKYHQICGKHALLARNPQK